MSITHRKRLLPVMLYSLEVVGELISNKVIINIVLISNNPFQAIPVFFISQFTLKSWVCPKITPCIRLMITLDKLPRQLKKRRSSIQGYPRVKKSLSRLWRIWICRIPSKLVRKPRLSCHTFRQSRACKHGLWPTRVYEQRKETEWSLILNMW